MLGTNGTILREKKQIMNEMSSYISEYRTYLSERCIYYANANEARLRMTHAISLTASPTRSRIVVMHNGE